MADMQHRRLAPDQRRALRAARRDPSFRYLGQLSTASVNSLVNYAVSKSSRDTTGTSSRHRALAGLPGESPDYRLSNYRQIALQKTRRGCAGDDPAAYTEFDINDPTTAMEIYRLIPDAYRCRIGVLDPGDALPLHIDDGTHRRFVALLSGEHSFQIVYKSQIVDVPMSVGEVWFINAAWPHMVINTGPTERYALLGMFKETAR